jgi:hypothetical protein
MRKRVDPIMAAMPEHVRSRFELIHLDAPMMMPALETCDINDKDGVGIGFKDPALAAAAAARKHGSNATPEQVKAEQRQLKVNLAIQAISYSRVIDAEVWSEQHRFPKRGRADLHESVERARKWLAAVEGDEEVMQEARKILDSPAPDSKQPRWWFIRAKGSSGEWIAQEYSERLLRTITTRMNMLTLAFLACSVRVLEPAASQSWAYRWRDHLQLWQYFR